MNAARAAFSYFTIFPVGYAEAPEADTLVYLPFVGAVVGAIAGTLAWAASLVLAQPIAVAVAFGISIVLTGAVHVDGFLDSCDALFASVPAERRLEIMKDPRHGTFAVAFFAVLCAVWLAALWSIPAAHWPLALAFAAATARWAVIWNACFIPYARAGSIARAFERRPPALGLVVTTLFVTVLGLALHALVAALAVVALGIALGGGAALKGRLGGGLTGDVYGFLIVCTEVALLLLVPVVP